MSATTSSVASTRGYSHAQAHVRSTLPASPTPSTTRAAEDTDKRFVPDAGPNEHSHEHSHGEHSHSHADGHGYRHHSHSHHHRHHHHGAEEGALLTNALRGKGDAGSRIALIALLMSVTLAVTKALAGIWLNSSALLADAAHSASDTVADLIALVCWHVAQAPANDRWPRGRRRIEPFGGILIATVLLAGAAGIGAHSASRLTPYLPPWLASMLSPALSFLSLGHAHSHGHGGHDSGHEEDVSDPLAILFVLLGLGAKEYLYRATMAVAKRENSSVLAASALHHRSDSMAEALVLCALVAAWAGMPMLDPVGGVVVACAIGVQGFELIGPALGQILDRGASTEERNALAAAVDKALSWSGSAPPVPLSDHAPPLEEGVTYRNLVILQSSAGTSASLTLVLPPHMSVVHAAEVEAVLRSELQQAHPHLGHIDIFYAPASPPPS